MAKKEEKKKVKPKKGDSVTKKAPKKSPAKKKKKKLKKKQDTWLKKILRIFLGLGLIGFLVSAGLFLYYSQDLPEIDEIKNISRRPSITIRDMSGTIVANYGDLYGRKTEYEQLPSHLVDALVATEDRRFFDHFGVDVVGLIRAVITNQLAGRVVQGGSTITQQLAKISFLSRERSLKRKIQEAILAIKLELRFNKEEILTMYLNRVYLGRGLYGVDSAARYYFGKRIDKLGMFESAIMIGMLKAPSKYSPANSKVLAIKRGRQVLYNMVNADFLTNDEVKKAYPPNFITRGAARGALKNPYFGDYVMDLLQDMFGNINKDINVYTTVDVKIQNQIEQSINKFMSHKLYDKYQAAAIVLSPKGAIRAILGGKTYIKSQFNRAINAKRQTGSAFKLFVFLAALQNGYDVHDIVTDQAININGWQPRNYSRQYLGNMSLTDAFAKSINTIAVQLSESIGRQKVIDIAHLLGVDSYILDSPSLALGTSEMSLLELTLGYANVANYGYSVSPYTILKVEDTSGQILYQHVDLPSKQLVDTKSIEKMRYLLHKSVEEGTSRNSKIRNLTSYGKTGTSQNHRDAWFVGFTDNLVTGLWVGTDDNAPMHKWITGGTFPTKIWKDYTTKLKGYKPSDVPFGKQTTKKRRKLRNFFQQESSKKITVFDNIDHLIKKNQKQSDTN